MSRSRTLPAFALLLLAGSPAANAQITPPSAAAAPDPLRLAAARALVEAIMPTGQRDAMIRGMITPMMANMEKGLMQSPDLVHAFEKQPEAREIFARFLKKQTEESLATLRKDFPDLVDAMANAYARRFTVAQLDEVRAFYETPTGHAFMAELPAVMADPDIARTQQAMMAESMAKAQTSLGELRAELSALDKAPEK